MPVREFILPTLLPPLNHVLGRLGYNPNKTEMDEVIRGQIIETIQWAGGYIHPAAHVLDVNIVKKQADITVLEGGLPLQSAKLSAILADAVSVSLLVCTIGNKLKEQAVKASDAGEMTRAVILDAVASEAVEAFADQITEILSRERQLQGLRPTMRYSPGYGDLKTDIHHALLPLLEAEKIGVRHHPGNFILTPEKTVTAVIGWVK